jgi:hypothetical protein
MITSTPVRRVLALMTVLAACTAPAATARVADAPVHQAALSTSVQTHGVPPRVNGIGDQPSDGNGRVAVPIVDPQSRAGFDWASAAIGAAAVLSLTLLGAAGLATLRGRRATPPHGNRAAS